MKLYWYERLMVLGEFDDSAKKQLRKINAGKLVSGVYLLMLPDADDIMLEIQPSQFLTQKFYRDNERYVIGAALSSELACELAARIVYSSYLYGCGGDLRKIFDTKFICRPDMDSILAV